MSNVAFYYFGSPSYLPYTLINGVIIIWEDSENEKKQVDRSGISSGFKMDQMDKYGFSFRY